MSKLKPQDLVNHLYKYKDAVVIIGDHVTKERNFKLDESTKGSLNRKNMVKDPKFFWEYYYQNVFLEDAYVGNETEEAIWNLLKVGVMPKTINQSAYTLESFDEVSKTVDLKGHFSDLICVKCRKTHYMDDVLADVAGNKPAKCECGGRIKPSIPMYSEGYDVVAYDEAINSIVKDKELQTHTLICIGVDFTEDIFHEIVQNFRALKYTTEETRYLVIVTDGDIEVINAYEADFATAGDMKDSIERLTALVKEGEK